MNVKSLLDCWASVVLVRAGGSSEAPTVDCALGTDEREAEWLAAAQIRIQGWHEAEKRKELYLDESINLSLADVLLKVIEADAPKFGKGREVTTRSHCPSVGKKGPSEVEAAYLTIKIAMNTYCTESGADLHKLEHSAMKLHPRKGVYEGLGSKESWRMSRFLGRHRATLAPFIEWCGTLVPHQSEKKSEENQVQTEPIVESP